MSNHLSEPGSDYQSALSSSLLVRVRARDPDAWRRLVAIYSPIAYRWCRRAELQPDDAMETVQEVFKSVVSSVEAFRRDRPGDTFHGWLRTITRNKIRDFFRGQHRRPAALGGSDAQRRFVELPDDSSLDEAVDGEDAVSQVVVSALRVVRSEFEEKTWEACWRTTVEGQSPADVANVLGMTVGAVYKAKSRVLARLRAELDGLAPL